MCMKCTPNLLHTKRTYILIFSGGHYMYTHLEEFIYKLLTSIGVKSPKDLEMYSIAKKLGIKVTYEEKKVFYTENEIILKRSTKAQEWLDFIHELCHYLRHCGSQLDMHPLFIELQEYQANYFVYHFCVPTFMLEQMDDCSVYNIMNTFNVDFKFASRRLEMWISKKRLLLSIG